MKATKLNRREVARALGLITQIGISMVICILGCILIGNFIDKKFDTSPIFLVIFIILGVGAAFRSLYMIAIRSSSINDDKTNNDKEK